MPKPDMKLALKKEDLKPEYIIEIVRLKSGFVYDEVGIRDIRQHAGGADIVFDYSRIGIKLGATLQPCTISREDFARLRGKAKDSGQPLKEVFATSDVVARVFADGAAQFNRQHTPAPEADAMEDAALIDELSQ